jgi:hypothetical protein
MPSKLTKTPKEELRPFFTNLGTRMRAMSISFGSFDLWVRVLE